MKQRAKSFKVSLGNLDIIENGELGEGIMKRRAKSLKVSLGNLDIIDNGELTIDN